MKKNRINRNHHQGIFIDIFPLDATPCEKNEFSSFLKKKKKLHNELILYCDHSFSFTDWKYNIKVFLLLLKIGIKGFHKYFKKYDFYIKQYNNKNLKHVSLVSWLYQDRYVREKAWYKDTIYMPFEDIIMPVPGNYHEILSKQFGDYMRPSQAPSMHLGFEYLTPNHSYKFILPKLRNRVRREKCKKIREWLKSTIKL